MIYCSLSKNGYHNPSESFIKIVSHDDGHNEISFLMILSIAEYAHVFAPLRHIKVCGMGVREDKNKMYNGYVGKTLYIDLTSEEFRVESTNMGFARKYLGSFGTGYRLAYDLIKPGIDPYSPENAIIISPGVFDGTSVPGSSRLCLFTKLPLIKAIAWSNGETNKKYAGV